MFERFTDQARRVVVLAQEEARLLNHQHIGTEHLLLGLLHEDDDETGRALQDAGATSAVVRRRLEDSPGRGKKEPRGHIPFTPRAKQALEQALRASQRLGQDSIGQAHLLRGLLEVRDGRGYRLLLELGVDTGTLAAVADELAASADLQRSGGSESIRVTRMGRAVSPIGAAPRPLSADEHAAQLAQLLAAERNALARGLRRYGRHDPGCDPARGCSCGLGELLEIAEPKPGEEP